MHTRFQCAINFKRVAPDVAARAAGDPPPSAAERAAALELLSQADRSALERLYASILEAGKAEPTPARARRLACIALSVVALAIYCRREIAKVRCAGSCARMRGRILVGALAIYCRREIAKVRVLQR